MCSMQSWNLRDLEIALRSLRVPRLRANLVNIKGIGSVYKGLIVNNWP